MKKYLAAVMAFFVMISLAGTTVHAGVTASSPADKANAGKIKWQVRLGTNQFHATTPPVAVGNSIYEASVNTLYRLDKKTGSTVSSCMLSSNVGFATKPVTYKDGVVYVPEGDGSAENPGRVEAVAVTDSGLTKKWTASSGSGQTINEIAYKSGRLYVGNSSGTFTCFDASDGAIIWTAEHAGGYYWSKAYVSDKFAIVGGDKSGRNSAALYSYDASTGAVAAKLEKFSAGISSDIVYKSGYVYFTCKDGYFYKIAFDNAAGTFGNIKKVPLGSPSTSTPVIYKGRAYLGTDGKKIMIVKTSTMKITKKITAPGPVKAELLLATKTKSGKKGGVTIYGTYNTSTGGIFFADVNKSGDVTAKGVLFKPLHRQYCAYIVTADSSGTLYYNNDSDYTMAVVKK